MFDDQNNIPMNYHDDNDQYNSLIGNMLSDKEGLKKSAAQKCQLCLPLWNRILEGVDEGWLTLQGNIGTIYSFHTLFYNDLLSIRYRVFGKGPHRFPDLESSVILWPQTESGTIESPLIPAEPKKLLGAEEMAVSDPTTISRWPQIFRWIHECQHKHPRCPKLSVSDASIWYPTRLLQVPEAGDAVKLVITSLERPSTAYVTLSHRWGTESMVILTAENLNDFLNEIRVLDLPKTFQDAITVARQLGIRYLWIDSLCILQSGEGAADDWNRESTSMHRVYGNAFCNIAATSAPDPNTGLFLDYPAEVDPPATVTMNFEGRDGRRDYIGDYTVINSDLWATVISRSPLMRRAWVFQERMLAPRVLHFASSQVFWECCTQQACETFAAGLPDFSQAQLDRVFRPATRTSFWKQLQAEPMGHTVSHYRNHHDLWTSIVEDYSRCQLTVAGDKLVALSGVAQRVAGFHKRSDYLAGNWREDFPFCLLWYSEPRPDAVAYSFRPAAYRAPSWSWASYEGAIIFAAGPFGSTICEVVDISLQPTLSFADDTATIAVATTPRGVDGSITLVGHIISAYWVMEESNTYEQFALAENDEVRGHWYPDEIKDLDDHYDDPSEVRFFCFVIDEGVTVGGYRFVTGITLVKTGEGEDRKGPYRRMGYFWLSGNEKVEVISAAEKREVIII